MVWVIITVVLCIVFFVLGDIDPIWMYVGGMLIFCVLLAALLGTSAYSKNNQDVTELTEVYEVCRNSDNNYFQANTAGNSITIRVKTNNGIKEKTFDREIVTFVDANSSTATVNYKKKEKFTSGEKFWFGLEDGKDAGKKKATKVILSIPLDSEQKVEDSTEQSCTAAKDQKESGTVECQECGSQNDADAEYCSKCGTKLMKEKTCTECGNKLNDGDIFCSKCGKKVE